MINFEKQEIDFEKKFTEYNNEVDDWGRVPAILFFR
jgi:hypothetical protein